MTASKMLQKTMRDADVSMGENTFRVEWKDDSVYLTGMADLLQANFI